MKYIQTVVLLFITALTFGQEFTQQDSLRGSITPERIWWDLQKYNLNITLNIHQKSIRGSNKIIFKALKSGRTRLQIDLQTPMVIEKITYHNDLDFQKRAP